ncbi:MAG TPA: cupin domain-containing protein [Candidatus Binatia bacterium]|jgi:quercetin dioxygenase-like cupin family protein
MADTVWSQLMALRDRQRALRAESPFVVRGADLPWETNPQGIMKWYLHPATERSCHKALIFSVQKIPPRSQSGKQHCQGGVVHYVEEGRGRTIINDVAYEWEAGDIVQLPLLPEGVTYQHFNDDASRDAILTACLPNFTEPLGIDRGAGLFQLEAAPQFSGAFESEADDLAALRARLVAESGKALEVKVDAPQTTYDRNYARTQEIQQRSRTGKVVVRRADRKEEMTRQGRLRYYLNRTVLHDTVLKDWNVFTHELRTRSGKHRHQGGLVLYVIEGKGYTICDGQRLDWERGDLILLPIQPGGVEHQHFNLNGDTPSFWMAYIYKPFHDEVAHGMEQREDAPEFKGE